MRTKAEAGVIKSLALETEVCHELMSAGSLRELGKATEWINLL